MPHVVLTTPPTQGHVRPALRLAELLAAREGHYCTVVLPVVSGSSVKKTNDLERVNVLTVEIPEAQCGRNVGLQWKWLETHKAEVIVHIKRNLSQPASAVVLDQFSVWSFCLAAHLDVPALVFIASPLFFLYMAYNQEALLALGDNPQPPDLTLPGLGSFAFEDLPVVHTDRKGWNYKWISDTFKHYHRASGFLANDMECLVTTEFRKHIQQQVSKPLWLIGPITTQPAPAPVDQSVAQFLQTHQEIVYIAFGSWCVMPQDHLAAFCEGIEQSGRPFIWAYRPLDPAHWTEILPEVEQAKLRPTDPSLFEDDGLPKGFRSRVKDRALILPWIDQTCVLQHPHVSVFATHCGWNSLLEAMFARRETALTFLCVPLAAEQSLNAAVVEKVWQTGIRVYLGGGSKPVIEAPQPEKIVQALNLLAEKIPNANKLASAVAAGKSELDKVQDYMQSLKPRHYDEGLP